MLQSSIIHNTIPYSSIDLLVKKKEKDFGDFVLIT